MAKGLFLIFPGHGHVNPTIGLVTELINKGDQITYITAEEFRDKLEKLGVEFKGYDEEYSVDPNNKEGMIAVVRKAIGIYRNLIELALKQEGTFDYLVCDSVVNPGKKLIRKLGIKKTISLSTTFGLNEKVIEESRKTNNFSELEKYKDKLKELEKDIKDLEKDFEMEIPDVTKIFLGAKMDLNLVFTSKYYQPLAETFDESYKFIGPSIADRKELQDFKIENPQNKKIVFISLGTVANKNLSFYKNCFEALGSRYDLIIIMSIGKRINIKDLGEIPENFKLYNYVPQLEVLKQVNLFITHGGMNSSSEGLYNNIPLIVVPQFGDQFMVAARVVQLSAGVSLIKDVDSDSIKEAVNKILENDSYKENARKIGESLKEAGGYKRGANLLHEIL